MQRISTLPRALAAIVLVASGPALAAAPTPATPLINPGDWVRSSDYPAYALRNKAEGTSRFRLTVDINGRVTKCEIVVGSGSEVLDEATCRLVTERARFAPATDRRRRPVVGTYQSSIRWQIPTDHELPRPAEVVSSHLISADGAFLECRIETASGQAAEKVEPGPIPCPATALDRGFPDADGKPVAKRVRTTYRTEVVDVTPEELDAAAKAAATAKAAAEQAAKAAEAAIEALGSAVPPPVPTKR